MPAPDKSASAHRLRVVLGTIFLSLSGALLAASPLSPVHDARSAVALNLLNQAILWGAVLRGDRALGRLLCFGLVFGAVELLADALCVRWTGTLDYASARSTMLWRSPWWMPLAWMVVATQIGTVGAALMDRLGPWRGALLCASLGAVNIPVYEELAYGAGWWRYVDCRRIGHTPLYIVVAELCIGLALAPAARAALRGSLVDALRAGALAGLACTLGGLVGYGLLEVALPALGI